MKVVVTGTDTDVGKTIFAAALAGATGASYWKPFQAGLDPPTDTCRVAELSGLPRSKILGEAYRLRTPASIHRAAEIDGVQIDVDALGVPDCEPLVIEGAGGALVPVSRTLLLADLFARWNLPVVIVARTALGTINHSLMTVEALKNRGLTILGMAFVGDAQDDSERTICEFAGVRRLGRLPMLKPLNDTTLSQAFAANFSLADFR